MEDKKPYIEQLLKIRAEAPLSFQELADELGISYSSMKRLIDPDDTSPARPLTIRKIKALINKYKDEVNM